MSTERSAWGWPLELEAFDRYPGLYDEERIALAERFSRAFRRGLTYERSGLPEESRLMRPIWETTRHCGYSRAQRHKAASRILAHMHQTQTSYFAWDREVWSELALREESGRTMLVCFAYLVCAYRDLEHSGVELFAIMARRVFGAALFEAANEQIAEVLRGLGYSQADLCAHRTCLGFLLLKNESPFLEDLKHELLEQVREVCPRRDTLHRVSKALRCLGLTSNTVRLRDPDSWQTKDYEAVTPAWIAWCRRWRRTATVQAQTKGAVYNTVARVGLWLCQHYPDLTSPAAWDRALCAEFIAAVNELKIGDWAFRTDHIQDRRGDPVSASTKESYLSAMRVFFRDLQRWEWIPIRLDPAYDFKTPTAIKRLLGPDPRDIELRLWLKLVWASLNLEPEDLPVCPTGGVRYPVEMVRALAIVWTHAALRANEILRLAVGCARKQETDLIDSDTGQVIPSGTVAYLDVPASKLTSACAKPVPPVVEEAIGTWQRIRPSQPPELDGKTGKRMHFLFSLRGSRPPTSYLNRTLIPMLCRKAGVPESDARGAITSHRGRASTVTMLANSKQGMTLLELMEWCLHRNPRTTMHYVRVKPTKLAAAFAKADRTSRMIEVLIDQEAVLSGAATAGEPWKYYDLGASYCTHVYWSTCPHRLACAACDFNVPKESARGQAIAAKAFLERYLEEVPLTEEERDVVEGDIGKFDAMLARLREVPTPDGRTPRQIEAEATIKEGFIPLTVLTYSK